MVRRMPKRGSRRLRIGLRLRTRKIEEGGDEHSGEDESLFYFYSFFRLSFLGSVLVDWAYTWDGQRWLGWWYMRPIVIAFRIRFGCTGRAVIAFQDTSSIDFSWC
jgi:hypothetical protein